MIAFEAAFLPLPSFASSGGPGPEQRWRNSVPGLLPFPASSLLVYRAEYSLFNQCLPSSTEISW